MRAALEGVDGIYHGLVQKLGYGMTCDMPVDVVDAVLAMTPRKAKVGMECANASAVI